jgi:hypothetical protein
MAVATGPAKEPIPFFTAGAAAGSSSDFIWRGGQMALTVKLTPGSLQMNIIDPEGNLIPVGAAITANGCTILNIPEGLVRAVATGGSGYTVYGSPFKTRTRL